MTELQAVVRTVLKHCEAHNADLSYEFEVGDTLEVHDVPESITAQDRDFAAKQRAKLPSFLAISPQWHWTPTGSIEKFHDRIGQDHHGRYLPVRSQVDSRALRRAL